MFIDSREIKRAWFYLNIIFIANYTISILRLFIRIGIPHLPNFFNILILLSSYLITLLDAIKKPGKLMSHPNTICLGLFLTFPDYILLIPFYILSIYHTNSFILSQKKNYEKLPFFNICAMIGQYSSHLGRTAMYFEVINIPLAIILMLLGRSSIRTVIAFMAVVRQQYVNNSTMKGVVGELMTYVDQVVSNLPDSFKGLYNQAKEFIYRHNSLAVEQKKTD